VKIHGAGEATRGLFYRGLQEIDDSCRAAARTTEYSAACCRSTRFLGGECNRMSVGTVLPQLALWEQSFLHLVFSQHLG